MKSRASYFSISKPLILENLRRFWAIPVLSFLVYFLSGIFPILMSYSHLNDMAGYIELSLNNQQPFYMFAHLMIPIMTAVIIFKYLQSVSSVSVMHSMPFTRAKLYNSGFISGLILILGPILLNGIILLAISKPAFSQYGTESGLVVNTVNLFARADILNWIWVSFIIALVVYAVSVFAGIVTGNSLMHFAMAGFFNFLIPGLYAVFIAYFSHFLYGFDTSGSWIDFCLSISPFLHAIQEGGQFGIGVTIYYIITFIVLYVVSALLYKKRKLEHATDSLAFGMMEPVICYLIAFLGMTMLGFYFDVLGESVFYLYAGLAAGTIIFFIIGQMIVKKTPRIFDLKGLRSFGIYVLIAVIFILCLNIDATGFEKRVPNPEKVDSFTFSENFNNRYETYNYYMANGEDIKQLELTDKNNIKAMIALHQSFLSNKERFEASQNLYSSTINIEYNPGNSFPMTRNYNIDFDFFRNSQELKTIYESKEYKDFYSIKNLQYEELKNIYIHSENPNSAGIEIKNLKGITEFMSCLDKDSHAQSFEDMVSLKHKYAIAEINYTYKNVESETPERTLDGTISYRITDGYTNTIKWLEDHGYAENFLQTADQIQYVEIFHHEGETESVNSGAISETAVLNPQGKSLKVTDPEDIQTILDSYETMNINFNDYYYGRVVYVGDTVNYEGWDAYNKDMYMEMEKQQTMDGSIQIYFNEGNIPQFILEYFQ